MSTVALVLTITAVALCGVISGFYAHWRQRSTVEHPEVTPPKTVRPGQFFGEELTQDGDARRFGGNAGGGGIPL
jgi:hypothetical protein